MLKKLIILLTLWLACCRVMEAGKTAAKAGLTGITQVSASSSVSGFNPDDIDTDFNRIPKRVNESALRFLKYNLFQNQGYDKGVRPVKNITNPVLVYIDFTYMQVLNLNEKEQTLHSLLRYRLYWKDQFLVWNPDDYAGITEIWLPAGAMWMPDIVCSEETGARDFRPRLPYVVVSHDGTVRYLEPTAYTTTCQIKISYFPFDVQTCIMTFTSWTFPTSKIDLMVRRSEEDIQSDIETYFSKSGEWQLLHIGVRKMSQNFLTVLPDVDTQSNLSEEENKLMMVQYYSIEPQLTVKEVTSLRISESHWSEIQYKLTFRRNSSLYIQSMLFPTILLTTISILGFYLPPESGERIGLQITILLTFMVFILTVGDMFPASTGPYLGLYFVLCMALLGLNIIMTVLVLHLHHIPCKLILITDPNSGESHSNMSVLPYWIQLGLLMTGVYGDLKGFAVSSKTSSKNKSLQSKSIIGTFFNKWRSATNPCAKSTQKEGFGALKVWDANGRGRKHKTLPGLLKLSSGNDRRNTPNNAQTSNTTAEYNEQIQGHTVQRGTEDDHWRKNVALMGEILSGVKSLKSSLATLAEHSESNSNIKEEQNTEAAMEEKWKSVARKVDFHCMVTYITLMIAFHVIIAVIMAIGV